MNVVLHGTKDSTEQVLASYLLDWLEIFPKSKDIGYLIEIHCPLQGSLGSRQNSALSRKMITLDKKLVFIDCHTKLVGEHSSK